MLELGVIDVGCPQPLDELGGLPAELRAALLQSIDEALAEQVENQAEGQKPSMIAATKTPAAAAATPRLVLSLCSTRLK